MIFLAPLFLLGLAAIAIPIYIHLTHRERKEPVVFPSLMFLRRIPYRTERRQRIRNWVLFLLRAAAVILVVAAFARPLLSSAAAAAAGLGSSREVVILLDRSYSMGYGDRWSRAVAAAQRVIAGLGPEDLATVVLFADVAEAGTRPTGEQAQLRAVIDAASPGAGTTRYVPALQLARDLLVSSERPQREVVLITDFQRIGWDGRQDVRLPAGTTIAPIDVSDAEPVNLAITGVQLERAGEGGQDRVTVSARVAGRNADSASVQVVLDLNGEDSRTATAAVPRNGAGVARFAPIPLADRPLLGTVRLARGDALPRDDAFFFVLHPPATVNVLLIEDAGARAAASLYVRRALSIGRSPAFRVESVRAAQARPKDFENRDLVIVSDAELPAGTIRLVRDYAAGGGGVLFVLGERSAGAGLTTAFPELLTRTVMTPVDRFGDRGGSVSIVDYHHPIFAPFAGSRGGDFSAARFFRYRHVETPATGTVLMRFDDGSPALIEARADSGRIIAWVSDLGNTWNDLPVQPVFLPFVHRMARHLARYEETPAWRQVGQVVDIGTLPAAAQRSSPTEELVLETPAGTRSAPIPGTPEARVRLDEAGFYRVRPVDERREATVLAVDPDVTESDLSRIEPEVLAGAVAPTDAAGTSRSATAEVLGSTELERRQGLWWYLLMAALLLLVAETVVAVRAPRTVRSSHA